MIEIYAKTKQDYQIDDLWRKVDKLRKVIKEAYASLIPEQNRALDITRARKLLEKALKELM